MNTPKTPANSKTTRFADSPSTPFTPFSARYAFSSPAYSTPPSSLNPSPVVLKNKSSQADLAPNWRERVANAKRLPLVKEEDGLLAAADLNRSHVHNDPFTTSDSSASDEDLGLSAPMAAIRVSLPPSNVAARPRSLFDILDIPAAPVAATRHTFTAHSARSSLPQRLSLAPSLAPISPSQPSSDVACFVCGFTSPTSERGHLTVLEPCNHRICRACLTQSLNIVGEKTFACACGSAIRDFYIVSSSTDAPSTVPAPAPPRPSPPSVGLASLLLGTAAPTSSGTSVLRIDNCPWDVSPPMLTAWCAPQTVVAAHIMLDRKGKTLSHAFIECSTADDARAVMRSCRTKILGHGRRARGVTLTVSSHDELAKNLFPTWEGRFAGGQPTLDGVPLGVAHSALARGVISTTELDTLLDLVQHPDSVFLKSPSLPFYALASLLATAPRAPFLVPAARARLYHVAVVALDRVLACLGAGAYDDEVLPALLPAACACAAFSERERGELREVARFVLRGPSLSV